MCIRVKHFTKKASAPTTELCFHKRDFIYIYIFVYIVHIYIYIYDRDYWKDELVTCILYKQLHDDL